MTIHSQELVEVGQVPLTVGRSPTAGLRLIHSSVSRRHATVERTDQGMTVIDRDSRCGTFVNGARVRRLCLQVGDRVQFGTVIAYRVEPAGRLRRDQTAGGARLDISGVSLCKGDKLLVKDAGFQIGPGTFVGILGPSGSGKSTLLNCLTGFLMPAQGRVVLDGAHDMSENRDFYKACLGYVTQDDVLYRSLTARENLDFAAKLALGATRRSIEIHQTVTHVLEQVELTDHQDKVTESLSGGQKKRLSVAMELLRSPRLLLLDEPTSGLDPGVETRLMERLKLISKQGTTVVCTTHLMGSMQSFDCVIVLGLMNRVGRVAYIGPPDGLLAYFNSRSFPDLYELLGRLD